MIWHSLQHPLYSSNLLVLKQSKQSKTSFKLGSFTPKQKKWIACKQPLLMLKMHPWVCQCHIYKHFTVVSKHRHLSNIDCLTVRTASLVCFISTVNGCSKKRSLGRQALVVGTKQTLSNLFGRLLISMVKS
jgi:hypothetical protein